jgi:hypothetical protein
MTDMLCEQAKMKLPYLRQPELRLPVSTTIPILPTQLARLIPEPFVASMVVGQASSSTRTFKYNRDKIELDRTLIF